MCLLTCFATLQLQRLTSWQRTLSLAPGFQLPYDYKAGQDLHTIKFFFFPFNTILSCLKILTNKKKPTSNSSQNVARIAVFCFNICFCLQYSFCVQIPFQRQFVLLPLKWRTLFMFKGVHWLRISLGWQEKEVQCSLKPSPYGTSSYQTV